MKSLERRVEALEATSPVNGPERWHWIVGKPGQSYVDAVADYEAEHGSMGEGDDAVFWEVIDEAGNPISEEVK